MKKGAQGPSQVKCCLDRTILPPRARRQTQTRATTNRSNYEKHQINIVDAPGSISEECGGGCGFIDITYRLNVVPR